MIMLHCFTLKYTANVHLKRNLCSSEYWIDLINLNVYKKKCLKFYPAIVAILNVWFTQKNKIKHFKRVAINQWFLCTYLFSMSCYLLKDRALSILLCLKIRINKQLCHIKFDNSCTTKVKHTNMYLDHQTTIIKKT